MEENFFELRKFVAPEFIFGVGARNLAGKYARNLGIQKVLIVTDPGVINAGWCTELQNSLENEAISYSIFSDITPNPRDHETMAGAKAYLENDCNGIIAIGGGSPMDCAKGIGIAVSNGQHVLEFEGVDEVKIPGPPLICIPTTSGTSADVSQFAIISDTKRMVKIAIVSKMVVPDVALIDPKTTTTMPKDLTAFTGLDALTHAIEAYCSNASSVITDLHSMEATRLILENLELAYQNPLEMVPRSKMTLGSLYAGLAFSNASLGAVHAMAHSLGGLLDFPHGQANAILLDLIVEFNFPAMPEKFRRLAASIGCNSTGSDQEVKDSIVGRIRTFKKAIGVTQTLGELGLNSNSIPDLAKNAMQDACIVTNPRIPTQRDIEELYEKALGK